MLNFLRTLHNNRSFKFLQSTNVFNMSPETLTVAPDAFPNVTRKIRMKQLWLLVWYESNQILEFDYRITDEYVRLFNGVFNGTLSYRSDSLIPHNFYGKGCHYTKTSTSQINDENWKAYEQSVMSKPRYVILHSG